MDTVEYQECQSVTLEWTVPGLKSLFENSRGETKSKVTKSVRFGGGRWQILFYPNSGQEGGFVSLYLSCEPTAEEKEQAINGKWVREGLFKFSFDLKTVNKTVTFNTKEACDHAFSYKTANWGWAQFAKRDVVYFQPNSVRQADAFLIVCTITSAPTSPQPTLVSTRRSVPSNLLDVVGSLLDDPFHSDIEFVLPRKPKAKVHGAREPRKIWAAKRLLKRVEYFDTMFTSGFAEAATSDTGDLLLAVGSSEPSNSRLASPRTTYSESTFQDSPSYTFDDSDESDSDEEVPPIPRRPGQPPPPPPRRDFVPTFPDSSALLSSRVTSSLWDPESNHLEPGSSVARLPPRPPSTIHAGEDEEMESGDVRQSQALPSGEELGGDGGRTSSLSHRSSFDVVDDDGRLSSMDIEKRKDENTDAHAGVDQEQTVVPGPKKTKVLVTDVAYTTYKGLLYYLYTDSIVFAPLSSNFQVLKTSQTSPPPPVTMAPSQGGVQGDLMAHIMSTRDKEKEKALMSSTGGARSRKEWIREWMTANPGKPSPCSAKAIYRLADKLDLRDLKARAFQHIVKSLTIANIPYEVFSSFSAAFDDVRKVEVDFFLTNFAQIKGSEDMKNIFSQVRFGRHPGFEEVWPAILANLRYEPPSSADAGGKEGPVGGREDMMS